MTTTILSRPFYRSGAMHHQSSSSFASQEHKWVLFSNTQTYSSQDMFTLTVLTQSREKKFVFFFSLSLCLFITRMKRAKEWGTSPARYQSFKLFFLCSPKLTRKKNYSFANKHTMYGSKQEQEWENPFLFSLIFWHSFALHEEREKILFSGLRNQTIN